MIRSFLNLLYKRVNNHKKRKRTAWVAVICNSQILLGLRSEKCNNSGKWNFFGGKIDPFEKPSHAARRELFEESRLNVHLDELQFITTIGDNYYYKVELMDKIELEPTDESEVIQWFDLDKLPEPLHKKTKILFLENYKLD